MTARDTYQSSVKTAMTAKTATLSANETTKQTTIDAAKTVVGHTLQTGSFTNLAAAVKAASQAKRDADFAAEQAKQTALMIARDTLRNAGGDTGAF